MEDQFGRTCALGKGLRRLRGETCAQNGSCIRLRCKTLSTPIQVLTQLSEGSPK
jgi:hypothetical protein